jgi:iron complex transport system ATP-binding protein
VLLARALAQEPQFIVLDEPTASLDFGNQGKVLREIRKLGSSGHGVLFTTHDPNHAMRAADRAYLLRGGERIGTAIERPFYLGSRLADPINPFTPDFLALTAKRAAYPNLPDNGRRYQRTT